MANGVQENILFRTDLTPNKIENFTQSFYGLQIDLSKLDVLVKSLQDYESEKIELLQRINTNKKEKPIHIKDLFAFSLMFLHMFSI